MAVTYNIKGTTNSSFKVGKQGTGTVYAGSIEANNLTATGNLNITGNLTVSGTTTTIDATTIDVKNAFRFENFSYYQKTLFLAPTKRIKWPVKER